MSREHCTRQTHDKRTFRDVYQLKLDDKIKPGGPSVRKKEEREREEERVEKEEVAGEHSTAPGVNEGSAHPERNRSHAARIRLKHTELSRRSSNRVSTSVHSSLSNYSLKQDCRCGNTI